MRPPTRVSQKIWNEQMTAMLGSLRPARLIFRLLVAMHRHKAADTSLQAQHRPGNTSARNLLSQPPRILFQ